MVIRDLIENVCATTVIQGMDFCGSEFEEVMACLFDMQKPSRVVGEWCLKEIA